jgi:metal-responsive CopG/Arc/MetJ family transcriptional regulator
MPVPVDMQHVPTIIEKRYVALIDQIARRERVSRSRAVRDLIIEALSQRFSLSDRFSEETETMSENQPADPITV